MRRQISVNLGCLWHLQLGSGVVWRPQAKIRQKRVIKVWIFRTLRRSCILCKWGARQAAGFRQEPRRSATEVYRCFQRTGRPPQNIKSAVVWFTRPFASSRTASFYPVQSKRWAANRGFPVDLFVWCRCVSRNGTEVSMHCMYKKSSCKNRYKMSDVSPSGIIKDKAWIRKAKCQTLYSDFEKTQNFYWPIVLVNLPQHEQCTVHSMCEMHLPKVFRSAVVADVGSALNQRPCRCENNLSVGSGMKWKLPWVRCTARQRRHATEWMDITFD